MLQYEALFRLLSGNRFDRIGTAWESHYSPPKMVHLALDGITSLSMRPVSIVSGFGIDYRIVKIVSVVVVSAWNFITRKIFLDASGAHDSERKGRL